MYEMSSDTELEGVTNQNTPKILENGLTAIDNQKVKRRIRMFFAQLFFSVILVIWLLWQLSITTDANWRTALFSSLSGIIGYWLPSPVS
jgi:hypothetical protein